MQLHLFKDNRKLSDFILDKTIRPIIKWKKKRDKEIRRKNINTAIGELTERLEPLIMEIFNEAVRDYEYSIVPRTHYANEAIRDLKKFYENKLKSFISNKE